MCSFPSSYHKASLLVTLVLISVVWGPDRRIDVFLFTESSSQGTQKAHSPVMKDYTSNHTRHPSYDLRHLPKLTSLISKPLIQASLISFQALSLTMESWAPGVCPWTRCEVGIQLPRPGQGHLSELESCAFPELAKNT